MLLVGGTILGSSASAQTSDSPSIFDVQSLDGFGNNKANPTWGQTGTKYIRVGAARYADGKSTPVTGPNGRFVSNRIMNDVHQNIFSERDVTQWGNVWGQFLDHTFGLAKGGGEAANIPFNANDPLEEFVNDLGVIPFTRDIAAPGTGVNNPREQINTVSSYIEASAVYGDTAARLEFLREGSVDGNLMNNTARLLLPDNYLPRRDVRGDPAAAPEMAIDGRLRSNPNAAKVAGDVRANENIALTATHTLFAREHNRIVGLLPNSLTQQQKFEIARRVVIAEQQFITYTEFLPTMGINLPAYTGYKNNVDASLSNDFATVGYRAHSQIHGEIEAETDLDRYTPAQLDAIRAQGVEVEIVGDEVTFIIPLNVAFFNPELVQQIGLGPVLQASGLEAEYNNDEMIDNQLRSVLFQIPVGGNPGCLDGPELPACFRGVVDLGAIDIQRGREHGMPSYNQMRAAYGLAPKTSFRAITGESTESFPFDRQINPFNAINDPDILDFLKLFDIDGNPIALDSPEAETSATDGVRRTTTAARLKAIYGSVNNVDAFTGMISEPHVPGSEFGELQRAIWTKQFKALRDGDRYFYGNDPGLNFIRLAYGIDFKRNLGDIIALNSDIPRADMEANVFKVAAP